MSVLGQRYREAEECAGVFSGRKEAVLRPRPGLREGCERRRRYDTDSYDWSYQGSIVLENGLVWPELYDFLLLSI